MNSLRDSPALRWYAASGPSPRGARKKYIKLTQIALPYGGSYGVHSDYISCQRFSSRAPKWEVKSGGKLESFIFQWGNLTLSISVRWNNDPSSLFQFISTFVFFLLFYCAALCDVLIGAYASDCK